MNTCKIQWMCSKPRPWRCSHVNECVHNPKLPFCMNTLIKLSRTPDIKKKKKHAQTHACTLERIISNAFMTHFFALWLLWWMANESVLYKVHSHHSESIIIECSQVLSVGLTMGQWIHSKYFDFHISRTLSPLSDQCCEFKSCSVYRMLFTNIRIHQDSCVCVCEKLRCVQTLILKYTYH